MRLNQILLVKVLMCCLVPLVCNADPDEPAFRKKPYFEPLDSRQEDELGYSAKLLLSMDGSLVGVCFRVWNVSNTDPLVLIRQAGTPPISCSLYAAGSSLKDSRLINRPKRRTKPWIEWTLKPGAVKDFFIPVRDLLPSDFEPDSKANYHIEIAVSLTPKGVPLGIEGHYPGFGYTVVRLTRDSLIADPLTEMLYAMLPD